METQTPAQFSAARLLADAPMSMEKLLSCRDATWFIREQKEDQQPSLLGFVDVNLPKLLIVALQDVSPHSERTSDSPTRSPSGAAPIGTNADSEWKSDQLNVADILHRQNSKPDAVASAVNLLKLYITSRPWTAIKRTVPACLSAMARPEMPSPSLALTIQALLLAAFGEDFAKTTKTIAVTLDAQIIDGIISNLSLSSTVGETILGLFGSALPAASMLAPTTKTELFTSAWINKGFPERFCAYHTVAIQNPKCYNYFYFFKEMLKRGYSHTAGPLVDVLCQKMLFASMLENTVLVCERNAKDIEPKNNMMAIDLSADAMSCLSATLKLIRRSLLVPETVEMYFHTGHHIAPFICVDALKHRLVALLAAPHPCWGTPVSKGRLGMRRLYICEAFVEMTRLQVEVGDRLVLECGFIPAFFDLCVAFANSDPLARLLHLCILQIFSRPLLDGETVDEALHRDALLAYIVASEKPNTGGGRPDGVLSPIVWVANAPEYRYTSLSIYCVHLLHCLSTSIYVQHKDGMYFPTLKSCLESQRIQERIHNMQEPITGDKYQPKGSHSWNSQAVVIHHPTINLTGHPYINTFINETLESPTWLDGPEVILHSDIAESLKDDDFCLLRGTTESEKPNEAAVVFDLEALDQEVKSLREAGSPQVQAYPCFRHMLLLFHSSTDSNCRYAGSNRQKGDQ